MEGKLAIDNYFIVSGGVSRCNLLDAASYRHSLRVVLGTTAFKRISGFIAVRILFYLDIYS